MTDGNTIDFKGIAEEFGTPTYVYDKSQIEENYRKLHQAFRESCPGARIHYSVKANSNLHILKVFAELGAGADCSSPMEIMLAERAGFVRPKVLYTGNYESDADFAAIPEDVQINFDDINSFRRLTKSRVPEVVSFRINPGIGRGGHEGIVTAGADAKFGVPYEKAILAYKIAQDAGAKRFGMHMMTGSNNLEPYYFAEIVDKLLTISGHIFPELEIKPEYFDIGGGFGVPYSDEESELDVELTAKLVGEIFREKCDKYGYGSPALLLEPGRFLVANAGYLVTRVTGVKSSYKTFVGIDGGMNALLRPALYGAKHRFFVVGKDGEELSANLCGQICENSDILLSGARMPKVEEGDLVVIRDVGAYGYAMSSNYNNRLRPAEVLVDHGAVRLIRRRETAEDIFRYYEE